MSVATVVEPLAYSVAEAAEALRLSQSKIRQMIKDDELRAGRVGDRVLVPREELGAGPSLIRGCGVDYDLGWPDGHF